MKKTLITLAALSLNFQFALAQNADSLRTQLIGNWRFETVTVEQELPAERLEMLNKMMAKVKMVYGENGRYALRGMGPDEDGNWSIKESGTHIVFVNDKDKTNEIEFRIEEDKTDYGSSRYGNETR